MVLVAQPFCQLLVCAICVVTRLCLFLSFKVTRATYSYKRNHNRPSCTFAATVCKCANDSFHKIPRDLALHRHDYIIRNAFGAHQATCRLGEWQQSNELREAKRNSNMREMFVGYQVCAFAI